MLDLQELDAGFADLEAACSALDQAFNRLDRQLGFSTPQPVHSTTDLTTTPRSTMSKIVLTPEVRAVLEASTIDATSVKLPSGALDRKLYVAVNKVIEAAGGKWSKKHQSHLFTSDPRTELGLALESNVIVDKAKARKKERQAFYTPAEAANTVAVFADIDGHLVLEPSAGEGALAAACLQYGAAQIHCIEIDADAAAALPYPAIKADFLHCLPRAPDVPPEFRHLYERIVMNPPFTRKRDLKHVMHAFAHWLCLGGVLTAIVADDNNDRRDVLAALSGSGATFNIVHRFPSGTFKESGTQIATLVIQLTK